MDAREDRDEGHWVTTTAPTIVSEWTPDEHGVICWVTRPGAPGAASAVLTHQELAAQSGPAQIEALKASRMANARRALKESDDDT